MRFSRAFVLGAVCMCFSISAYAEINATVKDEKVTLSGVSAEKNNVVNIIVQSKDGDIIFATQADTDNNGKFEVEFIPDAEKKEEHKVMVTDKNGDTDTMGYVYVEEEKEEDEDDDDSHGGGGGGGGSGSSRGGSGGVSFPAAVVPVTPVMENKEAEAAFDDIENHWAKAEIEAAFKEGLVKGADEDSFLPDSLITRAEVAALIARRLNLECKYSPYFTDVPEDAWYAPSVCALYESGIVSGYGDEFKPNLTITREEAAKILYSAYVFVKPESENVTADLTFADSEEIAEWARSYVAAAKALGLISGKGDNMMMPKDGTTRAEAVVMLRRVPVRGV